MFDALNLSWRKPTSKTECNAAINSHFELENIFFRCHKQIKNVSGPSNTSRGLTVNCSKARPSETPADLIALLSKQLSKSQVVDIFPPTLALTPKGTGAGYGVGMDLDTVFTDAQDHNTRYFHEIVNSIIIHHFILI